MGEIFDKIYGFLKSDGVLPWLAVAGAFYLFFPLGVIGLLIKLDVIVPEKMFNQHETRPWESKRESPRRHERKLIKI